MIEAGGIEALLGRVRDPEWLDANGASYQLKLVDHQAYSTAINQYISNKRGYLGRTVSAIQRIIPGLLCIASYLIALIYLITPQLFELPQLRLLAGAAFGLIFCSTLILVVSTINTRLNSEIDSRWIFRTIHVGIANEYLWIYNGIFLIVYCDQSFVDVIQFDHAILALANKTQAQWLPREKLLASEQGKKVLDWFVTRWPDRVAPSSDYIPFYTRRFKISKRRIWLRAVLILPLLAIVAGFYSSWHAERASFSTVCQFTTGWHDYASSPPLKIGSLCGRESGVYGRVVPKGVGPGI